MSIILFIIILGILVFVHEFGHFISAKFFGVRADIRYLAEWLNTFVTRTNRWASPKFLIGESYGTTRVSGLALELQNSHWMYLNGVILVSFGSRRVYPSGMVLSCGRRQQSEILKTSG